MAFKPKTISDWRDARPSELDDARDMIDTHKKNIESWQTYGCPHRDASSFSQEYSEIRIVFWTQVLLTGKIP